MKKKNRISDEVYAQYDPLRHELEVKMILLMQGKEQRREYLQGIEQKRGKVAADRLREDLLKAWVQK